MNPLPTYSIVLSFYRCQYHLVWAPKYKYKILKGNFGKELYRSIYIYCSMKKCTVVELNVQIDHIHLVVRTPRSLSVSELMGFVKGRMAIRLFAKFLNLRKYKLWGNHFLSKRIFCGFSRGKRRNHPTICTVPGQGSQRGRRKTNTSGTGRVVFKPPY